MKELIKKRFGSLRSEMANAGLDAFVITGADPHLSEYIPAHWETRRFITGFTGSAGLVVVAAEKAALWTDSRYFIQAEEELAGTGIELVRTRTPGYPEPEEWIRMNLNAGAQVGTDETCISVSQFRSMQFKLARSGITLRESEDLLHKIWTGRPPLPGSAVFEHELRYAGVSRKTKIETICSELEKSGANLQIITALDDLAWTFNLRGNDVECNPVFLAFASVSKEEVVLFTESCKLSTEIIHSLETDEIRIRNYDEILPWLKSLPSACRILLDPDRTNQAIRRSIPPQIAVIEGLSVPCRLKAVKTDAEIANIRQAMRKDGAAMLEFLYWLNNNIGKSGITEFTVAGKLTEFRSLQAGYKGISFFPIVGYKEHGAIVHFRATEKNALPIEKDGFLLFDSGGQYIDGTTDITRTIALSELTVSQKTDFTLVLKGMIALSRAKFPVDTRGYHLDILARNALWQNRLNYGHGTGHGVGYFLNVHEGPASIRQEFNDSAIEAGMVLSNEPGLYRQGEYGLRTENLIVCQKDETSELGDFLKFDTLTLCPIDTKAIEKSLLTPEEMEWLNNYHQRVFEELAPLVNEELKVFLKELTQPV